MMDRAIKPYKQVKAMLKNASSPWEKLVAHIRFFYIMDEKWAEGNPTHKHYNNLYFQRGGKTLVTLCIRKEYFIVSVVLGKEEREKFDKQRKTFGEVVCKEYDETETYHDGKWLGFEVSEESQIDDIIRLLHIKRKPNRKILPENLEKCGRLDLGLSHEDITNYLIT
jgi:hypothetical protein